ncbi:MAG: hypothetical protein LBL74_07135 [Bacteroidales bacterium]|jgi:hypothetical protein|nr:hypothetical protein [Bacteroidales bacterium]
MKKLFLSVCVLGSFALFSCGSKVDCDCAVDTVMNGDVMASQTYPMNDYDGKCSDITTEELSLPTLSIPGAGITMEYKISCTEK